MLRSYLHTAVRWIGTIIATGGIILLQTFLFWGSLLVKEYIYAEFDWSWFIKCIAVTIAEVFAAYRLMKAKWYVNSFGNVVFRLFAVVCILRTPSCIKVEMMRFSPNNIIQCNDLTTEIIASVFAIIEFVVIPIVLCIFTFMKKPLAEKNDDLKTGKF